LSSESHVFEDRPPNNRTLSLKTVLFKDKGLSGLPYVGSDFFAYLVVVTFAAVAGDHFADEA